MPLRISILTVDIGTGLAIDAKILGSVLKRLGHVVEIHEMRDRPVAAAAGDKPPDCAIFLEHFDPKWAGRFNVLIPNHEWIPASDVPLLGRFELVACKTRDAMARMRNVAPERLMYIGFTTLDRYRPTTDRQWNQCLHIAGCSMQKGTDAVLDAWTQNPDLPKLNVIDWRDKQPMYPLLPNVHRITERMSDESLLGLMNRCGVHVAPSSAEGFGHTIHEALSCGAVLVTTDAPPMNELTKDCAVLVKPARRGAMGLAVTYQVEPSQICAAVRKIMSMNEADRRALGQTARNTWEQNRQSFCRAVENMARIIAQRLSRSSGVIQAPTKTGLGSNLFRA